MVRKCTVVAKGHSALAMRVPSVLRFINDDSAKDFRPLLVMRLLLCLSIGS